MEKSEALRKVKQALALAASTTHDGERESAIDTATKLRLRFGISDEDLAEGDLNEDFELLGRRVFFYSKKIEPHIKRMKDEINLVAAELDKLDLEERMRQYCRFYTDVRALVENNAQWNMTEKETRVQFRRNQAVKDYYLWEKARWDALHRSNEGDIPGYHYEPDEITLHTHARDWTALYSELRKDTIENIVGIHERQLWKNLQKEWEEQDEQGS